MKLILLTPPDFFVEEDKILTALFEEGLDLLHLRKPDTEPVYSERLLTLLPESHHNQIVVHDHFYLKEEFNLRGIHLKESGASGRLQRTYQQIFPSYRRVESGKEKLQLCVSQPHFRQYIQIQLHIGF